MCVKTLLIHGMDRAHHMAEVTSNDYVMAQFLELAALFEASLNAFNDFVHDNKLD